MQAFQALADPALAGGRRFTDTTPVSWRMVEVGSGYFLYDVSMHACLACMRVCRRRPLCSNAAVHGLGAEPLDGPLRGACAGCAVLPS